MSREGMSREGMSREEKSDSEDSRLQSVLDVLEERLIDR